MATTKTTEERFNGTGSQTVFPFTIEYLATSDLQVFVNNVLQTETTHYSISGSSLTFVTAPASGTANVRIARSTGIDKARAVYAAGSSIRARDLTSNQDQVLFALQERENVITAQSSSTAPKSPLNGDRWYDTVSGRTYVYYTDADSSQWVEASPAQFHAAPPQITSISDAQVIGNAAIAQSKLNLAITNNEVDTSAAIDATKLSFTPSGTGATARSIDSKLEDVVSVKDFGAIGNGTTDDTTAITNAINASYGKILFFPKGTYLVTSTITIINGIILQGTEDSIIKMGSALSSTRLFSLEGNNRSVSKIIVKDLEFDGSSLTTSYWLENSSGAAITDPEADYVMGSGALASGITNTSLTAVLGDVVITQANITEADPGVFTSNGHGFETGDELTYTSNGTNLVTEDGTVADGTKLFVIKINDNTFNIASSYSNARNSLGLQVTNDGNDSQTFKTGKIKSVTINNGGSGWKGHSSKPYLADEVQLHFTGGGGFGAQGYGVLSGSPLAITSVVITTGGSGYTSAPTVTARGGFADIQLLIDSTINRRNPNYTTIPTVIRTRSTKDCVIENCEFNNVPGRAILEQGSLNLDINNCVFNACGKKDGPYHVIYAQNTQSSASTATGGIFKNTLTSGGSGFTNGCFFDVAVTGGSGSGAKATVKVVGNAVTDISIITIGTGYKPTETVGLTGYSGVTITVDSVEINPTEHIKIRNCRSFNSDRSFVALMPTKGGLIENCYIDGYKEAAIFISGVGNQSGNQIVIRNNTINNGIATDIVCHAIEAGAAENLVIDGNYIENCLETPLVLTGLTESTVINNTFKDNGLRYTEPYAPFSERYAFQSGERPISGKENGLENRFGVAAIGSLGKARSQWLSIKNNVVKDTRGTDSIGSLYPKFIFKQTKSGTDNIGRGGLIEGNVFDVPSDVRVLDDGIENVWLNPYYPRFKNNLNSESTGGVIIAKTFASGETGTHEVYCGFMPSNVHVFAAANNYAVGRSGQGIITFNGEPASAGKDFVQVISTVQTISTDSTVNRTNSSIHGDEFIRTMDANTKKFAAEFTSWEATGFKINVINAAEITKVRFVCYP